MDSLRITTTIFCLSKIMDYQNSIFRFLENYLVLDHRANGLTSEYIERFVFIKGHYVYVNHKLKMIHIPPELIDRLQKVFPITDSDCLYSIGEFFGYRFSIPMVGYSCVKMISWEVWGGGL